MVAAAKWAESTAKRPRAVIGSSLDILIDQIARERESDFLIKKEETFLLLLLSFVCFLRRSIRTGEEFIFLPLDFVYNLRNIDVCHG